MPPMTPARIPLLVASGSPESNCSTVRLIRVWAGTFQIVEWIALALRVPDQVRDPGGWLPYPLPIDPHRLHSQADGLAPGAGAEVKSTVGSGSGR